MLKKPYLTPSNTAFANTLHLSYPVANSVIPVLNTGTIFGQIFIGFLVDRLPVTTAILVTSVLATLAVFVIWGLSTTAPVLLLFAFLYGLTAGGYSSTWTGCAKYLKREIPDLETDVVMGLMAGGRGIGSVISGPVSSKLLDMKLWEGMGVKGGYGTPYGSLIAFTGVTAFLSGFSFLVRFRGRKALDIF